MRRNFCITLAAAIAACMGSGALAQTPVGNPGFEDLLQYDVPPALGSWTAFFGGAPVLAADNSGLPRNGASALYLSIFEDGTQLGNSFCGVQQPIGGIQPGVSYTLSHWARSARNVNNGVEFRIEWKDAVGGFIGNQFGLNTPIQDSLTSEYQQFTLTAVAPAGAVSCNLVFAVQSFTFDPLMPAFDTAVYIDDVEFTGEGGPAGPGGCCNPSTGECVVTEEATCTALGGTFLGSNAACEPASCDGVEVCAADFDNNGTVAVPDIFAFLSSWFAGCP
jgi:hypothetical protein